jgi:MEMO1 family protein
MPSPSEEHPGLFIRDPYRYSDAMLVIPPALVPCLESFDGAHTELDLREMLVRLTGSLEVGEVAENIGSALSAAGFLEDEQFIAMRDARHREFAEAPTREPSHAGAAYPAEPEAARELLTEFMTEGAGPTPDYDGDLLGIAAPHVSPAGGWQCYQSAYNLLKPEHRGRTFVILATSHYGDPETFGLTRKTFRTPLGDTATDTRLVEWLAANGGPGVVMEDYCHAFEHTVEFQVLFLQHALGPDVKILPILCGPFVHGLLNGTPEGDERVKRFLGALGELNARESDGLFWILGVDMAHMGARYHDDFPAFAREGAMQRVAQRDEARMARINASDASGFWDLVKQNRDDLKWCGSSSFYSFLKSVPGARGETLRYEQWNIDEQSVVSFAGMAFRKA